MSEIEDLRNAYEQAFRDFSSEVRRLLSLISLSGPDTPEVLHAQAQVGQAHATYRVRRDLLAESMMNPPQRIL